MVISLVGSGYAYLSVWPATARWMPSIFGIGIGMLVGIQASMGIFLGGVLKSVITLYYTRGKSGAERDEAQADAGNDTMLAGASVFAAGAVLSILLVIVVTLFEQIGWHPFDIAGH